MEKAVYQYEASVLNYKNQYKEWNFIINNEKKITMGAFQRNVNREDFKKIEKKLGYGRQNSMAHDVNLSFYTSILRDETNVYFIRHEGNEYIFYKNKKGEKK